MHSIAVYRRDLGKRVQYVLYEIPAIIVLYDNDDDSGDAVIDLLKVIIKIRFNPKACNTTRLCLHGRCGGGHAQSGCIATASLAFANFLTTSTD